MEEISSTFTDDATVRLLLVPLGGISKNKFDNYASLFESVAIMPLTGITHPDKWSASRSPFKIFSWSDGALKLKWLRSPLPSSSPSESTNKTYASEWQEFHAHRKIYGAIGILHYPTWEKAVSMELLNTNKGNQHITLSDVKGQLQQALQKACLNQSSATVSMQRVCVFGQPFEDQQQQSSKGSSTDVSTIASPDELVIFPPDDSTVGSVGDLRLVELHTQVVLDDLALRLILQLEEFTRAAATAAGLPKTLIKGSYPLSSPHDRECLLKVASGPSDSPAQSNKSSFLSSSSSSFSSNQSNAAALASAGVSKLTPSSSISTIGSTAQFDKRLKGRLNKLLGDYCLLATAAFDAARYYLLAVSECASNGDVMWQAGALMGLCSTLVEILAFRHPLRPHRRRSAPLLPPQDDQCHDQDDEVKKESDMGVGSGSLIGGRSKSSGELMSPTQRHLFGDDDHEVVAGGHANNQNVSIWKGSGDKLLLTHLEELCKLLPEFKDALPSSSSSSYFSRKSTTSDHANGGGSNSDETDAQIREECGKLEMDVLLKVVCDKAKEAVKVLSTLRDSPAAHTLAVELSLKVARLAGVSLYPPRLSECVHWMQYALFKHKDTPVTIPSSILPPPSSLLSKTFPYSRDGLHAIYFAKIAVECSILCRAVDDDYGQTVTEYDQVYGVVHFNQAAKSLLSKEGEVALNVTTPKKKSVDVATHKNKKKFSILLPRKRALYLLEAVRNFVIGGDWRSAIMCANHVMNYYNTIKPVHHAQGFGNKQARDSGDSKKQKTVYVSNDTWSSIRLSLLHGLADLYEYVSQYLKNEFVLNQIKKKRDLKSSAKQITELDVDLVVTTNIANMNHGDDAGGSDLELEYDLMSSGESAALHRDASFFRYQLATLIAEVELSYPTAKLLNSAQALRSHFSSVAMQESKLSQKDTLRQQQQQQLVNDQLSRSSSSLSMLSSMTSDTISRVSSSQNLVNSNITQQDLASSVSNNSLDQMIPCEQQPLTPVSSPLPVHNIDTSSISGGSAIAGTSSQLPLPLSSSTSLPVAHLRKNKNLAIHSDGNFGDDNTNGVKMIELLNNKSDLGVFGTASKLLPPPPPPPRPIPTSPLSSNMNQGTGKDTMIMTSISSEDFASLENNRLSAGITNTPKGGSNDSGLLVMSEEEEKIKRDELLIEKKNEEELASLLSRVNLLKPDEIGRVKELMEQLRKKPQPKPQASEQESVSASASSLSRASSSSSNLSDALTSNKFIEQMEPVMNEASKQARSLLSKLSSSSSGSFTNRTEATSSSIAAMSISSPIDVHSGPFPTTPLGPPPSLTDNIPTSPTAPVAVVSSPPPKMAGFSPSSVGMSSAQAHEAADKAAAPLIRAQELALEKLRKAGVGRGMKGSEVGDVLESIRISTVASQLHWPAIEQATLLYDVANDHKKEEAMSCINESNMIDDDDDDVPTSNSSIDNLVTYYGPSRLFQVLSVKPCAPPHSLKHIPVVMSTKVIEAAREFNDKYRPLEISTGDSEDEGDDDEESGADSSFIFNPYSKAEKETTYCVCGEKLTFHVRLINAFKVPLQLQSLQLKTRGISEVKQELCSSKLPPLAFKSKFKKSSKSSSVQQKSKHSQSKLQFADSFSHSRSSFNIVGDIVTNEDYASKDSLQSVLPVESIVKLSLTPMSTGEMLVEGLLAKTLNISSFTAVDADGIAEMFPTSIPLKSALSNVLSNRQLSKKINKKESGGKKKTGKVLLEENEDEDEDEDDDDNNEEIGTNKFHVLAAMPKLCFVHRSTTSSSLSVKSLDPLPGGEHFQLTKEVSPQSLLSSSHFKSNSTSNLSTVEHAEHAELYRTCNVYSFELVEEVISVVNRGNRSVGWLQLWSHAHLRDGDNHEEISVQSECLFHVDVDGCDGYTAASDADLPAEASNLDNRNEGKQDSGEMEYNKLLQKTFSAFGREALDVIRKQLPLKPGHSINIPIKFIAKPNIEKVEFNVYYSEHLNDHLNGNVTKKQRKSESRYMRQLLSSILLVHHDSICIKKFELLESASPFGRIFNEESKNHLTCSDSETLSALITISNQSPSEVNISYPTKAKEKKKSVDTKNKDDDKDDASIMVKNKEQAKVRPGESVRLSLSLQRLVAPDSYSDKLPNSNNKAVLVMHEINSLLKGETVWIRKSDVKPPSKDRIFEICMRAINANTFSKLSKVLKEASLLGVEGTCVQKAFLRYEALKHLAEQLPIQWTITKKDDQNRYCSTNADKVANTRIREEDKVDEEGQTGIPQGRYGALPLNEIITLDAQTKFEFDSSQSFSELFEASNELESNMKSLSAIESISDGVEQNASAVISTDNNAPILEALPHAVPTSSCDSHFDKVKELGYPLNFLIQAPLQLEISTDDKHADVQSATTAARAPAPAANLANGETVHRRKFKRKSASNNESKVTQSAEDGSGEFIHLNISLSDRRILRIEKEKEIQDMLMIASQNQELKLCEIRVSITPIVRRVQDLPNKATCSSDEGDNVLLNNGVKYTYHKSQLNQIQNSDVLLKNCTGVDQKNISNRCETLLKDSTKGVFWSGQLHHETCFPARELSTGDVKNDTENDVRDQVKMRVGICFTEPGLYAIGARCEYSFIAPSAATSPPQAEAAAATRALKDTDLGNSSIIAGPKHVMFSSSPLVIAVRDTC